MWKIKKFLLDLLESIILSIILIVILAGVTWVLFHLISFILVTLPTLNFSDNFDKWKIIGNGAAISVMSAAYIALKERQLLLE